MCGRTDHTVAHLAFVRFRSLGYVVWSSGDFQTHRDRKPGCRLMLAIRLFAARETDPTRTGLGANCNLLTVFTLGEVGLRMVAKPQFGTVFIFLFTLKNQKQDPNVR